MFLAMPAVAACAEFEEGLKEGARQGVAEGAMSVLGRMTIEEAADVKLTEDLDCTAGEVSGDETPIKCFGRTQDGTPVEVEGTVTQADPNGGVVNGTFVLTVDGREIAERDCIGLC